jgi:hypothetical protein
MQLTDRHGQPREVNIEALASLLGLPHYELPEPSPGQPTLIYQLRECIEEHQLEMIRDVVFHGGTQKEFRPCQSN